MINIDVDTPSHNCSCTFEPFSLKFHNSVKILQKDRFTFEVLK